MGYLPEEVVFSQKNLIMINRSNVEFLKQKAMKNVRTRIRLCTHLNLEDPVHEMMIVHAKGNYIPPHQHINKSESLHVLEGTADFFFFDKRGKIIKVVLLGDYKSGRIFYYRVSRAVYHALVITSDIFVFHEITKGPFIRAETIFAKWAPRENDIAAAGVYMENLMERKKRINRELIV